MGLVSSQEGTPEAHLHMVSLAHSLVFICGEGCQNCAHVVSDVIYVILLEVVSW